MKYFCLGYHDEKLWNTLSKDQSNALLKENLAYQNLLRQKGHLINDIALQNVRTAATLRFNAGTPSITDGPFAETKEQLGGVMILDAKDLNHAIQLASQLPCMRIGGSLEIRPINENVYGDLQ